MKITPENDFYAQTHHSHFGFVHENCASVKQISVKFTSCWVTRRRAPCQDPNQNNHFLNRNSLTPSLLKYESTNQLIVGETAMQLQGLIISNVVDKNHGSVWFSFATQLFMFAIINYIIGLIQAQFASCALTEPTVL